MRILNLAYSVVMVSKPEHAFRSSCQHPSSHFIQRQTPLLVQAAPPSEARQPLPQFLAISLRHNGHRLRSPLFLAALLDALGSSVHRALATSLGCHLLAGLLVCTPSQQFRSVGMVRRIVPARFFSRKALSSSSRSLACFLACFKGLTLPPKGTRG